MLERIPIDKIYFLDIETVPQFSDYHTIPENIKALWDHKAGLIRTQDALSEPAELYPRAGIYAEFGKIICISVGRFIIENGQKKFKVKSFYGDEEKKILEQLSYLLTNHFKPESHYLCAHNGREFDFPYITRRMIVNSMEIPLPLDNWGKKPWETEHLLDTMQLWKFGDVKNFTSLELLCTILDIPTPKDDIQGSDVWKVYWVDQDIERIRKYCEKDVVAIARLLQRFKRLDLVSDENIEFVR